MSPEQIKPLRELDPLLFQGSHPETGTFLWVSMLEVPQTNGTLGSGNERYRVQINLSWQVKHSSDEIGTTDTARLLQIRQKAVGFSDKLKSAIDTIPDGTLVTEIKLTDWPCGSWDNRDGAVTLIGDGAYTASPQFDTIKKLTGAHYSRSRDDHV